MMQPYRVAETYDPMTLRLLPYTEIAQFILARCQAYAPAVHALLDIACGTGNLTLPLAQLGYQMTGLDRAPAMLAIARQKATASQQPITFVCQDMCQPYPGAAVDAVTCFYGGLNFLTSAAALHHCFCAVYNVLKPGGLFAFDQFSPAKMHALFTGTKAADYGDFYVITKSTCDAADQIMHNVTFFLRNGEAHYRREEEQHQLRIHPPAEVQQLLQQAGFALLTVEPFYPQVQSKLLQDVSLLIAQKPM
jgi:ubiquinone/menaquinone biosynthesis C-methylase UbiE